MNDSSDCQSTFCSTMAPSNGEQLFIDFRVLSPKLIIVPYKITDIFSI